KRKKTPDQPFICKRKRPDCGPTSSFPSRNETRQPKFQCENCKEFFCRKDYLKIHMKRCLITSQKRTHECPHVRCAFHTNSHKKWIEHKKTHGKRFIYECKEPNCGKKYNHSTSFYSHKEKHLPKPQCENCNKSFSCKGSLKAHMKRCAL
ncbi:zinc finger protein, partial [Loa loa]